MGEDSRGAGSLLVYFVVFLGLAGGAGLLWWLPQRAKQTRMFNERHASTTMKVLTSAEADFRANDRDGNGVNDFWTGDIAGLYKYGLIPRELAEADAAPLAPLVPQPIPYRGYFYKALLRDASETPPLEYRQDTDKKSGPVHNRERFGFVAYPADPWKTGKYSYLINENNTAFRSPASVPPPSNFPDDAGLKSAWSKYD
jgi:hypothetical protein